MHNQIWHITVLGSLFLAILSACRSTPAPTQEPVATNPPPTEAVQISNTTAEPVISLEPGAAYPAPTIEYVQYNPYPAPLEGENMEWSKIPDLLASGNVSEVRQLTTLVIVITLRDGKVILTTAPAKDEIFTLLDQCGGNCNNIRRLSEW